MKRADVADQVYFERFVVDRRAHILFRDGKRVALQEQPFQILLALLEPPGEVVTRDALRFRLWGADTFVDFNQSMNSAVRRLRQALGDDPHAPSYVETIPRVGYRFIADVALSGEPQAALPEGTHGIEHSGELRFRSWRNSWMRSVNSWLRAIHWQDPLIATWCVVVFACLMLFPWARARSLMMHFPGSESPAKTRLGNEQLPRAASSRAEPVAIAVLPLRNLTGNIADQYVVDGITEAVTTKLAERPGLRVMSQFPSTQLASKDELPEALAEQTNASSVLEGAVRRQGNQVWITTRLFDTRHRTYLWAKTYTESARDLAKDEISVADEVARRVDSRLSNRITPPEPEK